MNPRSSHINMISSSQQSSLTSRCSRPGRATQPEHSSAERSALA